MAVAFNKSAEFLFPAPFEVDRFLYECTYFINDMGGWFPAPREVDRELYENYYERTFERAWFPTPREVGIYTQLSQ